jgi:hypothetical protein
MLYQSHTILKDGEPVTCKIVDNSNKMWVVEYYDDGVFVRTEINPSDIKFLDYCLSEISQ